MSVEFFKPAIDDYDLLMRDVADAMGVEATSHTDVMLAAVGYLVSSMETAADALDKMALDGEAVPMIAASMDDLSRIQTKLALAMSVAGAR